MQACKNKETQKVECVSLDISNSYDDIESTFNNLERSMGQIYMLINCAGTAICGKIEDTTVENLKHMINLNFMGTYYCIKAVVPKMKSANEGIIVVTSSQAGLSGRRLFKTRFEHETDDFDKEFQHIYKDFKEYSNNFKIIRKFK